MSELFRTEFLEAVSRLRIGARQVAAGGRHGEHRSRAAGAGLEFRDYRPYVAGDDVRRVDWKLYQRSGRLFTRLFEETQDLPVYVLLDMSDSMFFEDPPRANAARQAAAAFAAMALNQHDRVLLWPFGEQLGQSLPAASGKSALRRLLAGIEGLAPAGTTNVVGSLQRFGHMKLRQGLAVIVSDFFDPNGLQTVLDAMLQLRHRLLLVQVSRPSDAEPELAGEIKLLDCETGRDTNVFVNPACLQRYRQAYQEFSEGLTSFATLRQAPLLNLDAEHDVLEQLDPLFQHGLLQV